MDLPVFVTACFLAVAVVGGEGSPVSPKYDTIVIGLGSSGTTAASTLARAGKHVLALEGLNRIGGRVHTQPFGEGVVEVGAEWIHGTHPSITYDLAVQNNITISTQGSETRVYRSDGTLANTLEEQLVSFALTLVGDPPDSNISESIGKYNTRKLETYLREKKPEALNDKEFWEPFLQFIEQVINEYFGSTSWDDVNIESPYESLDGPEEASWAKNGYKTFFDILLNQYNNGPGLPTLDIKLSTEVTLITWSEDPKQKVQVTTKDGIVYTADNVIVTIPLGVLKEKHASLFSPQLPQSKVTAIEKIAYGLLDKIIFTFPTVWWSPTKDLSYGFLWKAEDKKTVPQEDVWTTKIAEATYPMGSDNALTLWSTGDNAKFIETLPEDVVQRKCMELLRRFMGANTTIPEPTGMIRTKWFTNRFARGSYSYDNMESNLYPTARKDLGVPLTDSEGTPRVLFAGEATNEIHYATVHGASETGTREAKRLLPELGT